MYRVAICEDEEQQRELTKHHLLALSMKANMDFNVAIFASGEELIQHYEKGLQPFHIIILDVEMSGRNGIQTAKRLREMKRLDEQFVFLTSYPEYMIESFDVMTFQYLIKPVDPTILEEKLLLLCHYFQANDKKFLIIKSGYDEIVLKYDDIVGFEAAKSLTIKNKLHVYTTSQTIDSKGIIADYAATLRDHHFIQIHRAVIINLLHVRKFSSGSVVMSSGMEFPIGRSKLKEVKDIYTKYMITKVR